MRFSRSSFLAVATAALAVGFGLPACSGNGNAPSPVTSAQIQSNVLQLAVGTANIQGTPGLNVFTTYRQPQGAYHPGDSGALVNSPTFSGPFTLGAISGTAADVYFSTIEGGPSTSEIGGSQMTATGQNATNETSFGQSGGAFGVGLEPFNYNATGVPDNVAPYTLPLYDGAGDPNAFVPWGGPPAFDPNGDGQGTRDGNAYPTGQLGISEGLDVFANLTPASGTYTLSVSVPANTGTVVQKVNAAISSTALLPPVTAPSPSLDGSGGGTFGVALPSGVTEAYVQIIDVGLNGSTGLVSCNGSSASNPTYYTIAVSSSGPATLPDQDGPISAASTKTQTLCTPAENAAANPVPSPSPGATAPPTTPPDGDHFNVQLIGFDYPAFEASYPKSSGNPAPPVAGSNGQADVTISPIAFFKQLPSGTVVPGTRAPLPRPAVTRTGRAGLPSRVRHR